MDKIENGVAALVGDDGAMIYVKTESFGFTVECRDILFFDEETGMYVLDKEERAKRENEYQLRIKRLFKR